MRIGQYAITDELGGNTYGKGEIDGLAMVQEPAAHYNDQTGEYTTSIDEEEMHEEKLWALPGFDTLEEAEKAAEPLISRKIPFLCINQLANFDENIVYFQRRKWLTNAHGEKEAER